MNLLETLDSAHRNFVNGKGGFELLAEAYLKAEKLNQELATVTAQKDELLTACRAALTLLNTVLAAYA